MAKESKIKEDLQKKRLEKELAGLLPEIMEEGLLYLIRQANTIIHNQRAAHLNEEMKELNSRKDKPSGTPSSIRDEFEIEISRSDNGKTYYFIVNGRKHFFDIPETKKLVALCYKPQTKSASIKFLYEFFINERDEILLEHKIKSEKSRFFEELFKAIRNNFSLEE